MSLGERVSWVWAAPAIRGWPMSSQMLASQPGRSAVSAAALKPRRQPFGRDWNGKVPDSDSNTWFRSCDALHYSVPLLHYASSLSTIQHNPVSHSQVVTYPLQQEIGSAGAHRKKCLEQRNSHPALCLTIRGEKTLYVPE